MSIWRYLRDRIADIILYLVAVALVYVLSSLDASLQMRPDNINYLVIILLAIGMIYLAVNYIVKRARIHRIQGLDRKHARVSMPPPADYKEQCYQTLIHEVVTQAEAAASVKERENQEEIVFLTQLAHRMKTPLSSLSLIADQSQERDALFSELFRLKEDVDKMLYYARGRDFSTDYVIEAAGLNKIVSASVKKHAWLFISKSLRFEQDNLDITVLTDRKGLGFILDQMISNAVKYSHTGETVLISAEEENDAVRLTVSDSGVGIGKDDLPRVFGRSFTGSNGRLNTQATGMGLYLADQTAKKLGHRLTICSQKGRGTDVTVHISKYTDGLM